MNLTRFEPDGVYNGVPYRVLPDCSIEAMTTSGLVKFKNMDQLLTSFIGARTRSDAMPSVNPLGALNNVKEEIIDIPTLTGSVDYYSVLREAIKTTKQNSAQLRALVYETARFNLKREALFARSPTDLTELAQKMDQLERAVSHIEASVKDDPPDQIHHKQSKQLAVTDGSSNAAIQILPPEPIAPLHAGPQSIQWSDNFQVSRLTEEFVRRARLSNVFTGLAFLGMAAIGAAIIAVVVWPSYKGSPLPIIKNVPQPVVTAVKPSEPKENITEPTKSASKLPFPLPTSFGIYVLSNNKLTELQGLPIGIPDARIELSPEIRQPSLTTISDSKPAFILFRRDLLNNAPQKIMLRVVAQTMKETKIVNGKTLTSDVEGSWRIRNISRELKISPIEGQREMVIARLDDDVSLAAGRYALVLNRTGYDFTITGSVKSPVFCLEAFETTNGSVFTQCKIP